MEHLNRPCLHPSLLVTSYLPRRFIRPMLRVLGLANVKVLLVLAVVRATALVIVQAIVQTIA